MLIGMRNQARADKNFALSDQIRDQLVALEYN
jgi:cysteinyl-tRNA synthetase